MTRELLPNDTPIEAGPIVIIDSVFDHSQYMDTHIYCEDLAIEAITHGLIRRDAELAMLFSVRALIAHFDLGILSPHEAVTLRNGDVWGPYEPYDYCIDLRTYFESNNIIMEHATDSVDDEDVIEMIQLGKEFAEEKLSYETGLMTVEDLPGAVYTATHPKKHLEEGNLIGYRDFAAVVGTLGTSSSKVASLFDEVVFILGDGRAIEELQKLETIAHPLSRRYVRDSLYIKTQALADLIQQSSSSNSKGRDRRGFNNLSMRILRHVLSDENPEIPAPILDA